MNKYIAPSITLQSFNCPRCGALAHQTWHKAYTNKEDNNSPHIWTPSEVTQILEKFESDESSLPAKMAKDFQRLANGEIFIENVEESTYANYRLNNVFLSKCYSCKEIALWVHNKLIYPPQPDAEEANADMSADIRKDYEEARIILKHSPRGAAALLRLCIEKLCDELAAKGKNLDQKIGDLVKRGLNEKVQKSLDAVRVTGNEAVHPGQFDLNDNPEIARALFKLVNLIIQELITDKNEIDKIYELVVPEEKQQSINKRDGNGDAANDENSEFGDSVSANK